ncbi:MAG: aminopeptidase [Chloroflexi bacterium]|nr:aminopeptidase [Chloroflexota bacterium]MCI0579098.1 aminopeptidase [Chloroflexota bacterium]MCI0650080.1 aminopeptidase [Chloroflexota bacterium]MCI0728294.1 aminopeptidase [Chloroflexota bacterium]
MNDPRVTKLACLLANYCVAVKPGDKVAINSNLAGLPLLTETYREVLRAGGYPLLFWQEDEFLEILLKEGNDDQLRYIPEAIKIVNDTYDCRISVRGSGNTRTLSGVDPARQRTLQAAGQELFATFMRRSATGELRWVGTLFPSNAYAQEADMSLSDFEDFVYSACYVDKEDPVAEWQKISAEQQKLVDWLKGKKEVAVRGPDIDMTLSIADRTFINSDGKHNMPSGEIFTGPVEESVNGWVCFTYPAISNGREVSGIELQFENGQITKASAKKNEEFLLAMLDTDPGARYLGEFAIGTNNNIQRFTKSILFDEKIGGTLHMAVGAGYPETGSKNVSAIHWDMICDMRNGGQMWVDGELFYDSGRFLI